MVREVVDERVGRDGALGERGGRGRVVGRSFQVLRRGDEVRIPGYEEGVSV